MSDEKHSPGPWRWDGPDSEVIYDADNVEVCRFVAGNADKFEPDAALIARAPDLLAGVERLRAELAMTKQAIDAISEDYRAERAARERVERERNEARSWAKQLAGMLAAENTERLTAVDRAERLESALREIAGGEVWDGSVVHVVPPRVRQYAHRATLSPPVEAGEGAKCGETFLGEYVCECQSGHAGGHRSWTQGISLAPAPAPPPEPKR